ncbi:MAG: hypothetical protein ACHQFX_00055 [Chitinophagales bacterium]
MKKIFTAGCLALFAFLAGYSVGHFYEEIPRSWDEKKLSSGQIPLVDTSIKGTPVPEEYYYRIPERVIYKTYPMYIPGREPKDYYKWLRQQEPQVVFDPALMRTDKDWIQAGETIFDMPTGFIPIDSAFLKTLPSLAKNWNKINTPLTKEGIIPFLSVMVKEKGVLQLGILSCGMCHTKVMPDGGLLKGAQGNYPFDRDLPILFSYDPAQDKPTDTLSAFTREIFYSLFAAPWIKEKNQEIWNQSDAVYREKIVKDLQASIPGVIHRHGTTISYPVSVPDLFNIKERKYFDRTGLMRHRDIGDLMRYASLNQEADFLNDYGGFFPVKRPVHPETGDTITRFSDPQLFALAKFIYALKTPQNPHPPSAELIKRGEKVFIEEDCITCHTPPFYSSGKLTPASGFIPPKDHLAQYDIYEESLGTDPGLALYTRRGTGYYKVPSLIGAWNRTAFLHSGYLATLEDMFSKRRLQNDYIPNGYKPASAKTMAIVGHKYGLDLNEEDKKALIAFIRSL